MIRPTRRTENMLKKQGYSLIAGIDEVGKGALAGPLVTACVILPDDAIIKGLRDSKLLSPLQRMKLFITITKQALGWSVSSISQSLVDSVGITQANRLAFIHALKKSPITPEYVLIDGKEISSIPYPYKYIVDGDAFVVSIAAASIVAKVIRDHMMNTIHNEYPHYEFASHKGYGTIRHLKALKHYGPCYYHRRSFRPIKK